MDGFFEGQWMVLRGAMDGKPCSPTWVFKPFFRNASWTLNASNSGDQFT